MTFFCNNRRRGSVGQQGFTIVELMISISVLSLILLLSTYSILQLGSIFSKGTNMASTQNTARNLLANITSQLQLGGANPIFVPADGNVSGAAQSHAGVLCIGSQRYSFVLNHKLTKDDKDHVLWHDTMNSGSTCKAIDPIDGTSPNPSDGLNTSSPNNGSELMPLNTRLIDLYVTTFNGLYVVNVAVAYGDDDTITYAPRTFLRPPSSSCKGNDGDEFCAVSALEKTIVPRLTQ